jgi:hypothetical protein
MKKRKSYVFEVKEFAVILDFFSRYVELVHSKRTLVEHEHFIEENFGVIKKIQYDILNGKLTKSQFDKFSMISSDVEDNYEDFFRKTIEILSN